MIYKVPVRTMQYLIHFSPVRIEYNKYEQQVALRTSFSCTYAVSYVVPRFTIFRRVRNSDWLPVQVQVQVEVLLYFVLRTDTILHMIGTTQLNIDVKTSGLDSSSSLPLFSPPAHGKMIFKKNWSHTNRAAV